MSFYIFYTLILVIGTLFYVWRKMWRLMLLYAHKRTCVYYIRDNSVRFGEADRFNMWITQMEIQYYSQIDENNTEFFIDVLKRSVRYFLEPQKYEITKSMKTALRIPRIVLIIGYFCPALLDVYLRKFYKKLE